MRARKRRFYRRRLRERYQRQADLIQCWCGAVGTYDELFDSSVYSRTCGGTCSLDCECAGDGCCCHNHGEVECPGCDDCRDGYEDDWYGYDGEDDE